jgi:hypothetical protein
MCGRDAGIDLCQVSYHHLRSPGVKLLKTDLGIDGNGQEALRDIRLAGLSLLERVWLNACP